MTYTATTWVNGGTALNATNLNKLENGLATVSAATSNVDNTSNATERAATATLTNKTIDLTDNTVNGTLAEFSAAVSDANLASVAGTETLTNKRVTPRVATVADAATVTPTADAADLYTVTALAQAATIAAPSGTPTDGQRLILRLLDNGTGRALTWNAIYRAVGVTLPTTTVATKTHYVTFIYNSADSKWDAIQVLAQA